MAHIDVEPDQVVFRIDKTDGSPAHGLKTIAVRGDEVDYIECLCGDAFHNMDVSDTPFLFRYFNRHVAEKLVAQEKVAPSRDAVQQMIDESIERHRQSAHRPGEY